MGLEYYWRNIFAFIKEELLHPYCHILLHVVDRSSFSQIGE